MKREPKVIDGDSFCLRGNGFKIVGRFAENGDIFAKVIMDRNVPAYDMNQALHLIRRDNLCRDGFYKCAMKQVLLTKLANTIGAAVEVGPK